MGEADDLRDGLCDEPDELEPSDSWLCDVYADRSASSLEKDRVEDWERVSASGRDGRRRVSTGELTLWVVLVDTGIEKLRAGADRSSGRGRGARVDMFIVSEGFLPMR